MPTPGTTYPTPSTTTTTTTGGYYSEDDKHKLFQAVGRTGDNALIVEVAEKLGLSNAAGQPTPALQPFIKEHLNWALRNTAWVQEYSDPVKARQYVMANK